MDKKAMESVLKTLRTLENFYKITGTDNMSAESTESLWKEIRINLSDIPNASIFKAVMYLKDKQLQNIKAMNKHISNKCLGFLYSPSTKKESFSSYKIKLAKAKASLLGVVSKYIKARKERTQLEEYFVKIYIEFVDKLQHKLNLNTSKSDEVVEDIMSNYLLQLTSINFSNSENEYLEKQIEHLRTDIENTNMQIQNHEVLLGFIRKVYCDINASVNRLQFEMIQLSLIKSKIVYSKNVLQQMLNQMKSSASTTSRWSMDLRNSFLQPQKKINDITFSAESFAMGTENVLCSTKFDFDNTVSSLSSNTLLQSFCSGDTTIISTGTNNNLPAYLLELNIFAETPIEHFSRMAQQCAFHLSPNPIVTATQELSPAVQFTPGALLTTYGALNEIISRIKLAKHFARSSGDAKFKLDLIHIDTNLLNEKQKLQQERILQIFDKIKETNVSTDYILNKCSKLYNFRLENPLRHYIPPSKTFNDQTYSEYESEYNLYYRLATEDTSTN
ncbi:augmin complex subunit dgt5-like [Teleopsis dalmanni]|uniref:augmin complex subunit dgt5-like n=1 Tax=Teleopsis dalmanni TaxID=139649 RepID=UPI0018CCBC31|nr:augmin complex subunit dgt5-like [Teleopsis dalmanni]